MQRNKYRRTRQCMNFHSSKTDLHNAMNAKGQRREQYFNSKTCFQTSCVPFFSSKLVQNENLRDSCENSSVQLLRAESQSTKHQNVSKLFLEFLRNLSQKLFYLPEACAIFEPSIDMDDAAMPRGIGGKPFM